MNRSRHLHVLVLLVASGFPVWGWLDFVPVNDPVPAPARFGKQLFVPNNTTTIPALKSNRRSKAEHLALKDGSIYFGELAGFDAQRDFFGNIRTLRRIFGYPSSMPIHPAGPTRNARKFSES